MKIYTSYFAQMRNFPKNIVPVNIAVVQPRWYNGFRCIELAPSYKNVRAYKDGVISWDEFRLCYERDVLAKLTPYQVCDRLRSISLDGEVALLCYEKPSDNCHRHIVADWLNNGSPYVVTELFN